MKDLFPSLTRFVAIFAIGISNLTYLGTLRADGTNVQPFQISRIIRTNDQVSLSLKGVVHPYRIQWRPALASAQWLEFTNSYTSTNIQFTVVSPTAFFRAVTDIPQLSSNARYRVVFQTTWTAENHPTDFPSNPHFSGLIGGTHNSQISFWAIGEPASSGIESMAEGGNKSPLDSEINAAITARTAGNLLSGGGVGSPGSVSLEFGVSQQHPLVTLVSMIAPSPDWFVGVRDLNLCPDGRWVDSLVVELQPYDAGTDSGITFVSGNSDTQPGEPITRITGFPFQNNGTVAPLGTFTFTRIDAD